MIKPCLNHSVLLSPISDGYVAYDTEEDQLHKLNPIASLIIEMCDGSRSIDEIETMLQAFVPHGETNVVRDWIVEAINAELLISKQDKTVVQREMTPEQLSNLADKLRENGKIQTAYLCQKQAAEMTPDSAANWSQLGELAHIAGLREVARESYEHYLTISPDDAEVQHILVALRDDTPPPRVPDECIEQLYERFSTFYDSNLVDELDYVVPERLSEAIESVFPGRTDLKVLDMGCGTGLSGERLQPRAKRLEGIDLSADMIKRAKKRNLYDSLEVAEITAWLEASMPEEHKRYDLIVACDTLIYFGDLSQVIQPASRLLKSGGAIAFSVERSAQPGFELTDSGRYAHHATHIQEVAQSAGLECAVHREAFLRMEYGEEVIGHIIVLTKTTDSLE